MSTLAWACPSSFSTDWAATSTCRSNIAPRSPAFACWPTSRWASRVGYDLSWNLAGDPAMRVWAGKMDGGLIVDSDGSQVAADGGDQSSFDMHLTVCTDYDPATGEYGAVIDGSLLPAPPRAVRGGAGRKMPGRPDSQAGISPWRRLTVTMPRNTAGDLKITVSAPGRAPLIVVRHLARPGWVSGRVIGVAHGGELGRGARVTLRLEQARGRMASGTDMEQ